MAHFEFLEHISYDGFAIFWSFSVILSLYYSLQAYSLNIHSQSEVAMEEEAYGGHQSHQHHHQAQQEVQMIRSIQGITLGCTVTGTPTILTDMIHY